VLQKKTQPMSTSGTKKPISVGMADFFTCSMKPPSERLTTSIVMMNVATGAAKENRTTDSVVVPNSDVTLDQDVTENINEVWLHIRNCRRIGNACDLHNCPCRRLRLFGTHVRAKRMPQTFPPDCIRAQR
jgi:hypothetical protein